MTFYKKIMNEVFLSLFLLFCHKLHLIQKYNVTLLLKILHFIFSININCTFDNLLCIYSASKDLNVFFFLSHLISIIIYLYYNFVIYFNKWFLLFNRDTSGQGRFCTIFRSYSRGAQVNMLIFAKFLYLMYFSKSFRN